MGWGGEQGGLTRPRLAHFAWGYALALNAGPLVTERPSLPLPSDPSSLSNNALPSLFETELEIRTPKGNIRIVSAMLGRPNVLNMLTAVAVGVSLDLPMEAVVAGIEAVEAVPGRFEMIDEGQPFAVIVDYAHTPDALERLLRSVRECGARRILTVFGCGGDRDRTKRPIMGRIAHELSDVVFLTNDNIRTEAAEKIIADVVAGWPAEVTQAHPTATFNWLQVRGRGLTDGLVADIWPKTGRLVTH